MNRLAIFISNYSIGNSPSIINLVNFLSKKFDLDIYLKSVSLINIPALVKNNIKIINLNKSGFNRFFLKFVNKRQESDYFHYICLDPAGFVLCKKYFPFSNPIYYSLELYLKNDHFGLDYPAEIMKIEREKINEISGLIIQSEEKEMIFREDYNLLQKIPAFLLPVTYEGNSIHEKSDFLRDLYDIKEDKKISLHLGGIAEWFSPIELAIAFSKLDNWVLFFQGYQQKEYFKKLQTVLEESNIQNVILSDKVYPTIDELHPILQSCDIGIAWYNDISIGFRIAGKSSGKIPMYMRFGLPIIAKKYPSTIESIEKTKCGICIDSFDEIQSAAVKILDNYEKYSINAYVEYDRSYNFENYEGRLLMFINQNRGSVIR
jgi:glycosyltransferase involved in cell wall biosynthesis